VIRKVVVIPLQGHADWTLGCPVRHPHHAPIPLGNRELWTAFPYRHSIPFYPSASAQGQAEKTRIGFRIGGIEHAELERGLCPLAIVLSGALSRACSNCADALAFPVGCEPAECRGTG